jgi:ubiquinone/menaquinone biosynthesis C-methylase UbiE
VGPTGRVVGVDVTLGMLNQAKAKKNDQGDKYSNVELYEGDILRLDTIEALQNRVFDKITVACALVLLPDPHTAIMHWKRYLKPGGIIALDSTHPRNLISGIVLERTGKRLGLPIPYFRDWSTSEHALNEVLEGAGLEVEKVITIQDQAGYGRRYQDVSEWDDHFTQQILVGDIATVFANPEIRRKAQAVYKDEWEKLAVNEFVEEVDAVFFGIARKRKSSPLSK